MSQIDEQRRLHLEKKALEALKERIGKESYLSVLEVAKRLNFSRDKVEAIPFEILPYSDYGTTGRSQRRYHPADVLAVDAVLRAYARARERHEGEAFMAERRVMLEERDRIALSITADLSQPAA